MTEKGGLLFNGLYESLLKIFHVSLTTTTTSTTYAAAAAIAAVCDFDDVAGAFCIGATDEL